MALSSQTMASPDTVIVLRTERLVLRRATMGDVDALHAIMTDAETMRYWSTLPHRSKKVTATFLAYSIPGPDAEGDEFMIEYGGAAIGKVGIWQHAELGFILARDFWGKGVAREALSAFIGYAFDDRTDHLTADVDPRNAASLGLLKRLGFSETRRAKRTWQIAGIWSDSVYLRLDRAAN